MGMTTLTPIKANWCVLVFAASLASCSSNSGVGSIAEHTPPASILRNTSKEGTLKLRISVPGRRPIMFKNRLGVVDIRFRFYRDQPFICLSANRTVSDGDALLYAFDIAKKINPSARRCEYFFIYAFDGFVHATPHILVDIK